jgi:hypothetical protein
MTLPIPPRIGVQGFCLKAGVALCSLRDTTPGSGFNCRVALGIGSCQLWMSVSSAFQSLSTQT